MNVRARATTQARVQNTLHANLPCRCVYRLRLEQRDACMPIRVMDLTWLRTLGALLLEKVGRDVFPRRVLSHDQRAAAADDLAQLSSRG